MRALVPLRHGALAALTVANYHHRHSALTIGKDKAGAELNGTSMAMIEKHDGHLRAEDAAAAFARLARGTP